MSHPLTTAWLAAAPQAVALLPRAYASAEARAACVARAAARTMTAPVLAAITAQNAALTPAPARDAHLSALARGGAACVVTGQQVGLFLGPLYTLYKAASAVSAARKLATETGCPVVPVFWLQNEDHDFDEIARVAAPSPDGPTWFEATVEDADPRCAIAARAWSDSVTRALDALDEALDGLPHAARVSALFRRSYRPGVSPCRAFSEVLAELFAADGLIIVDPSAPEMATLAAPVHRRAITDAGPLADALCRRADALRSAGYTVQVHVRPGAPLSFYHPAGPRGPRMRLAHADDAGWTLVGEDVRVAQETLERDLELHPDRFSTSALLRPILQDHWLPTAAYVGGPGELAYFGQLGPLYEAFDLPQPMALLRARFEVINPKARRLLAALSLDTDTLAEPRDALLARVGAAGTGAGAPDQLQAALVDATTAALAAARPAADALGGNLGKHFDKTGQAMTDFARRLCDRYRRALATADGVTTQRLDALLAWFRPDGAPQERIYGAPYFLARFGVDGFLNAVRDGIDPFVPGLRALDLSTEPST